METISRDLLTFLLNSLWQAPLVAGVAALACHLLRRGPAGHRHAIWVAALAAAALLPLASIRPAQPVSTPQYAVPDAEAAAPATHAAAAPSRPAPAVTPGPRTISFAQATATGLLAIYGLFLLYQFSRLAWAWVRTVQIRRAARARSVTPLVEQVWTRCLTAFQVNGVELLAADIPSPVTVGAWRKVILLPDALFEEASAAVLTTAIGHEMAHVARRDFAWNLVYELLCLPLSFHPAIRMICRGVERTRELACDELVTRRVLDRGAYARAIMSIAETATALRRPGYTLGVFDADILEERIRRLVERPVANLKRARVLLATGLSSLAACVVIASGLALTARAQGGVQAEMKLAGEAYNLGDFRGAVQHFENAVNLDPSNPDSKLFLANALMQEFFAEKGSPDSPLMTHARQQYLDVLARDPRHKPAMQGVIAVDLARQQPNEGHDWAMKLIQLDSKDKGGYYTAGVLDWSLVYPAFVRARQASGSKPTDYYIADPAMRKTFREQSAPHLEEGFRMLQIALELDANYDDAMAYMNLLYRLQAAMMDSPAESKELMVKADDWVGKALATRRQRAKGQPPQPAPLDVNGPPPGPASPQPLRAPGPTPPPPPPPPPPPTGLERPGLYWELDGDTEETQARLLRGKGFPVLSLISVQDKLPHLVVGPYSDQESFGRAKVALQTSGFQPLRVIVVGR